MATKKKQIGEILLSRKAITLEALERALSRPASAGRLASRLASEGLIDERAGLKALSEQHGVPGIDLTRVCVRLSDLDLVPREIAQEQLILPILVRTDRLFVAMASPTEQRLIDELEFVTGKRVFPYVALAGPLGEFIARCYASRESGEEYLVGELCPPEVLAKVGLEPIGGVSVPPPEGQAALPGEFMPSAVPVPAAADEFDGSSEPKESKEPKEPKEPKGPEPSAPIPRPGSRGGPDASPPSTPPGEAPFSSPPGALAAGGVLDEARGKGPELGEEGFGDTSGEVSSVGELGSIVASGEGTGKVVLVVDDEREIRQLVRTLLEKRGYQVLEAERGSVALRMVKEHCPDLLILDAMLPEVHGFDIARQITGSERYGHVPIVMISAVYRGWRFAEDLRESCGVQHYIEKPFSIRQLLESVDAALAPPSSAPGEAEDVALSKDAERALNSGVAAYRAGHLDAAISHLKRGVQIDPLAFRLHFHLGLLYGKSERAYEAIGELEAAARINPRHFQTVKNLAILYQRAGFRNKAVEMWERALSLASDPSTRETVKQQLLGLL